MLLPLEPSGLMIAAVIVMATCIVLFVAWNCMIDMLRPPWGWAPRAARAITQRLGGGLSPAEQDRLEAELCRVIAGDDGDAQDLAPRRATWRVVNRRKQTVQATAGVNGHEFDKTLQ